ncbi:MAG TPA: sigma-70 family RNA polymerase sigma factor [Acidimicrobiales bacterium]|jgi:RNA polymerase sigma factor (sigma-70 family)|nr:sigma-70 family RNA polymerase sigma factor [Acidimicrobiales bacterium]
MTVEDVAVFCRRLHPVLLGGLTLHCRDRGVAEEVTQETLVRVWERWPTVGAGRSPEAWAWRVALNLTASRFRRRAVEQRAQARLEAQVAVAATGGPPDEADRLAVRAAVADLPERQRAVLVLRFYADLSIADTAEALRCAEGTVKSLTNKAVGGLRRRLDDETLVEVDHA